MNQTSGHTEGEPLNTCCSADRAEAGAEKPVRKTMRSRLRALLRNEEEGTQLVELAFVAPIFMVMLTGVASFAMALYNYQQLGYAVSTSAQYVATAAGMTTSGFDPCAAIVTQVTSALPSWTASKFTYTVAITSGSGSSTTVNTYGPTAGSGFSCSSGYSKLTVNEPMVVTVSYAYSWLTVLTWAPNNTAKPSGSLTVTEAALVQ